MARGTVYPKPLAGPEMWSLVESLVKGSVNSYKDKNHIPKNRITESEYQDLKRQCHPGKNTSCFLYLKETDVNLFVCLLFPAPLSKIPFKRNLNLKTVKFKQALALRNDFCDVNL